MMPDIAKRKRIATIICIAAIVFGIIVSTAGRLLVRQLGYGFGSELVASTVGAIFIAGGATVLIAMGRERRAARALNKPRD